VDDDGAGRQIEHGRHDQPSRHLDAHDRSSYVPAHMSAAAEAPFIVVGDGGSSRLQDLARHLDT